MFEIEATRLHAKITGGLFGGALGDAMGGPVEGLHYRDIEQRHGCVTSLLPYTKLPSEHTQFTNHAGSYTDDTRLHLILCKALITSNGDVTRGDFARALIDYRNTHPGPLARSFIEKHYLKGLYGSRRLIFGGQPTNGALMANGAVGLIHPADPKGAFRVAFELAYIADGYAKESAAMGAAVAAAMRPGATAASVLEETLHTADWFRRDRPHWQETMHTRDWTRFEGRPNHKLVTAADEVAQRHGDVATMREELYARLQVSLLGSEAGQTLAVALAMVVAANGDYEAVRGAVNYGRYNGSYAVVAGTIAGALQGLGALPTAWVQTLLEANPSPDLKEMARALTSLTLAQHREHRRPASDVEDLLA